MELMVLQWCDCIAWVISVLMVLAFSQNLLYRLLGRIQIASSQWLSLPGVLAVPGIQSASLTGCSGPLNPFLSDNN